MLLTVGAVCLLSSSLDTNVFIWNMEKPTKRIAIKGAHPQHDVTSVSRKP